MEDSHKKEKATFLTGLLAVFIGLKFYQEHGTILNTIIATNAISYKLGTLLDISITSLALSLYFYAFSYIFRDKTNIFSKITSFIGDTAYILGLTLPVLILTNSIINISPIGKFLLNYPNFLLRVNELALLITLGGYIYYFYLFIKKTELEMKQLIKKQKDFLIKIIST